VFSVQISLLQIFCFFLTLFPNNNFLSMISFNHSLTLIFFLQFYFALHYPYSSYIINLEKKLRRSSYHTPNCFSLCVTEKPHNPRSHMLLSTTLRRTGRIVTNTMEQSLEKMIVTQLVRRLCNLKIYYGVHKDPQLNPAWSI
jgi:hypothetical protein